MSKEIPYRIFGILQALYLRIIGYFQKRVVEGQKEELSVRLEKEELEVVEYQDESLPRMAYFKFRCENGSDIPFEINRVRLWIEITDKNDNRPKRKERQSYPVANIDEDTYSIEHATIGQIDGNSSTVQRRGGKENIELYTVEFEVPPWFGEVRKMYVFGFLELQRNVYRAFEMDLKDGNVIS